MTGYLFMLATCESPVFSVPSFSPERGGFALFAEKASYGIHLILAQGLCVFIEDRSTVVPAITAPGIKSMPTALHPEPPHGLFASRRLLPISNCYSTLYIVYKSNFATATNVACSS
jgi:hypothetical protein